MERNRTNTKGIMGRLRGLFYGTKSQFNELVTANNVDYGVTVNHDAALRFTAVYAAIKILSENVAALPKSVKVSTSSGLVDAPEHPVSRVLGVQPNEYTDVFTFWMLLCSWLEGKGNAFALKEYEGNTIKALHQIAPDYVAVHFVKGAKVYVVNHPDPDFAFLNGTYLDHEMLHFMLFSKNGIVGIDPITYNAAAIGRGIATQKFSGDFYRKGGQIKGVMETDGELDDVTYDHFMAHFNSSKNFEVPLLEYGIKYKPIGITPIAAQLIQSETLSIQDIARIFSIPPHLLAEMTHATFSNIEQQNIFFSVYSLRPLCKRIEQQLELKMFTDAERGKYSIKFDLRGMMRGDDQSRAAYYASGINAGWMTPNEARVLENMVTLPGLDQARVPLNTGLVDGNGKLINPNSNETV